MVPMNLFKSQLSSSSLRELIVIRFIINAG